MPPTSRESDSQSTGAHVSSSVPHKHNEAPPAVAISATFTAEALEPTLGFETRSEAFEDVGRRSRRPTVFGAAQVAVRFVRALNAPLKDASVQVRYYARKAYSRLKRMNNSLRTSGFFWNTPCMTLTFMTEWVSRTPRAMAHM